MGNGVKDAGIVDKERKMKEMLREQIKGSGKWSNGWGNR